jgi:hypothetical protein
MPHTQSERHGQRKVKHSQEYPANEITDESAESFPGFPSSL